ncbi:hypothetical protein GCM10023337_02020 [Paenalcaligenes hermetiae]|mgnify:CR=1 FL=1|uniref:DUF3460 domain-containing protein n=2 Tax=Alcaligenaceae TaxID=506 RepID=A0ABP9LW28_9BURK
MRIARRSWGESGVGSDDMCFVGSVCSTLRVCLMTSLRTIMAKNYESEITQFLNDFKKQNPAIEAGQREGRARLWDKHIDPELQEGYRAAAVPQPPYVYYQDN